MKSLNLKAIGVAVAACAPLLKRLNLKAVGVTVVGFALLFSAMSVLTSAHAAAGNVPVILADKKPAKAYPAPTQAEARKKAEMAVAARASGITPDGAFGAMVMVPNPFKEGAKLPAFKFAAKLGFDGEQVPGTLHAMNTEGSNWVFRFVPETPLEVENMSAICGTIPYPGCMTANTLEAVMLSPSAKMVGYGLRNGETEMVAMVIDGVPTFTFSTEGDMVGNNGTTQAVIDQAMTELGMKK